ncbi:MAG: hypothetical protein J2P25_05705 [Nocardiopsaceae bacterium]|nr:hypothetical protein [Nocardiopsaceae bacterium]
MAFSVVIKRRSLRGLGLYRGYGRRAAPKSDVRLTPEGSVKPNHQYHGLHKASGPRLSGPYEKRAAARAA